MAGNEATVRLGRRPFERDAVVAFPLDRALGAAVGERRWLKVTAEGLFRPFGFVVWGVSDPPPRPATADAPVPPAFSWCHRFMIRGVDQLIMTGGFGLHYFRVPVSFEDLLSTLVTPAGEKVPDPLGNSFWGVLRPHVDIRRLLMIPAHCELDFSTASIGDELAVQVSGPLDRVVAWGRVALP